MADIQARLEAMRHWLDTDKRCQWPEQRRYEILRSVVLYGQSPAERALETGVPRSTLYHRTRRFKELGMMSLFTDVDATERPSKPTLPPDMRQFIVDLKAEHPPVRSNEIATCLRPAAEPAHRAARPGGWATARPNGAPLPALPRDDARGGQTGGHRTAR